MIAALADVERSGLAKISRLPFSIRILLEGVLRRHALGLATDEDVEAIARWSPDHPSGREIPFLPSRVLLQDFTGIPLVCDLAALREAAGALGIDPNRLNPVLPVDLVIDHSVQVDAFGTPDALEQNLAREYARNEERYAFLRWGQQAFSNFRIVPPGTGIVHQVNLERLATVVCEREAGDRTWVFPDTLVGTDSHTTMVNGLGVLGFGVGGIEAEAAMLGIPQGLKVPEVVGVRLSGALPEGSSATDAVLAITERLRKAGVVEKFVEFFGPGFPTLPVSDRATIANMAPEYGATVGFFPVDAQTLAYLRLTGRDEARVLLVEEYAKAQGLWADPAEPPPAYSSVVEFDLSAVEPSLAGPKRPQDRVPLSRAASAFREALASPVEKRGFGLPEARAKESPPAPAIGHGAVAIAAITSCTNTSNPALMLG
ncbi:MAG: aconitase family protein, partial [Planctomycetota bacterium]